MNLDDAAGTWDILAECAEQFIDAWDNAQSPPSIAAIVPERPVVTRRLALIELIKIDLEYRVVREMPKQIEEYLNEFHELITEEGIPCDLVYEEYQIRKMQGEAVDPNEYFDRFPKEATQLKRLMGMHAPAITTTLQHHKKAEDVEVGESIDDFDLLIKLGSGAFASVFLARQRSMQRLVAVKISATQADEPQTLAQLDHPHIVRVFDHRVVQSRGLHLLYMQYVAGGTLHDVIEQASQVAPAERSGKLFLEVLEGSLARRGEVVPHDTSFQRQLRRASWAEVVCRVGGGLAEALAYAYDKDVLHRDVKPANVLLAADGTPKLADFNVSYGGTVEGSTADAFFGGSLAYMSPEQLEACNPNHARQARDLDGRSDLYSLCIMLWEMLEGVRPFHDQVLPEGWSATVTAMLDSRKQDPPRLGKESKPDLLTVHVRDVLTKCMSVDPDDRYADGMQLARALRMCLHPQTLYLMSPPADWRIWLRTFPILCVMATIVLPHAVAAVFNLVYNYNEIITDLTPEHQDSFFHAVNVVNAIVFPLGITVLVIFGWPIRQVLQRLRAGDAADVTLGKRRAYQFGDVAAAVGIMLWTVAGFAFPIILQVIVGGISPTVFGHFCVSNVLCGLIGASYPFLLTTFVTTRGILPPMLLHQEPDEHDEEALHHLSWWSSTHLLVAGTVPMLGLALIVAASFNESFDTPFRVILLFMSIAGFAGFAGAFALNRVIQRDIEALLVAVQPGEGEI